MHMPAWLRRGMAALRTLALCAALQSIIGFTMPARAAPSAAELLDGTLDAARHAARARVARDLMQEISTVLRRIGTPPDHEKETVAEEMAAIERLRDPAAVQARAQQLYASAAFQQQRLYNTFTVVKEALACAAEESEALQREMTCWAITGAYLGDRNYFDEALTVLARSGRLPREGGMTATRWSGETALWARYGRAIHDYITIPYLRSRLD